MWESSQTGVSFIPAAYAAFGADKKEGTFEVSGYVDDGFVGVTRPIEEYSQYKGEFADPLEITEEGLEKFCLFSPLIANLNMRGIAEGELYGSDLVQYLEIIEEAIERERCEGEEARGLMHYFDESREVAAKVVSAHPKVADVDGELYGVLECKIRDPLTEEEIKITIDRKESKKFRIYQLGQKSPVTMRFISLAERRKRGYDRPHRGEYVLVHEEEIEKFNLEEVWEKYGQAVPENFAGHALAISDVIEFADGDANRFFYIDAAGYEEIQF